MPLSSAEARSALLLVASEGVADLEALLASLAGPSTSMRSDLLDAVPALIDYYALGSSALAVDYYDDERDAAGARKRFTSEPVIADRSEKVGRMVAWASEPLFDPEPDVQKVALRLVPEVEKEIARPFRDTITANSERDPSSTGWRRVTSGTGCKLCRMLADRGAVYKASTARFAAHGSCHCSAAPVFDGQDGPEASVMQYVASQKRRSEKDRARLREYLNANY
jgi:hypothetical protein